MREARRDRAEGCPLLNSLQEAAARYTESQAGPGPYVTAVPGMTLLRSDHVKRTNFHICKPALCIVVQGAKWTMFGERRFDYQAGQVLVVNVEIPAFSTIVEASPSEPYLGVIVEFDLAIMREVVNSLDEVPAMADGVARSVFVTKFDSPLADCVLRLLRLLDTPRAIPVLYPAIMREICYWLLTGPHGAEVISMTIGKRHTRHVLNAVHFLRDHFAEPVRVEDLASIAQVSPSAFHRQFKAVTSMTPLQYQKQLRLLEARRLMVADELNVGTTAAQVGYESPTQFIREYGRMFGLPPRRDITNLKQAAARL